MAPMIAAGLLRRLPAARPGSISVDDRLHLWPVHIIFYNSTGGLKKGGDLFHGESADWANGMPKKLLQYQSVAV